ncbi:hypothetical protein [Amycolatopsis sp. cmx-4-68]|uniref:hypothetical protein n=1 Tax=Amycolatopsis sp. cmx-4-68 TaxID=2790938 RepID=UPI00397A8216
MTLSRSSWRRVAVAAVVCAALTGTSFAPAPAAPETGRAMAGQARGIAVDGRIATTADIPSDVRHG